MFRPRRPDWYSAGKARLDVVLAALLLIPAVPVILLAAFLVKLTSRGPAIYSQTRLGLGGTIFTIYKLRTMTHECEKSSGPCWAQDADPRVTWLGAFLRRYHLDELPQLWNVIRGDMSLVGPRPERPEFLPELKREVPFYCSRLDVRPGITGLAQVQLRHDTNIASVRRKVAHDLHYVRHYSVGLDLRILLATVFYVLGLPPAVMVAVRLVPGGKRVEYAYWNLSITRGRVAEIDFHPDRPLPLPVGELELAAVG